jgi:hypothetical protein
MTGATHYAIVRTQVQNMGKFVQIAICGAFYITSFDASASDPIGVAQQTAWDSGQATQIYFDINTLLLFTENNSAAYVNNNILAGTPYLSYEFQPGDRLQLVLDASSGSEQPFQQLWDLQITGQYKNYVIVDYLIELPEIVQGMIVQIYTPKRDAIIKTFYEIGEVYPIIPDGFGNFYHGGPDQDQDANNPAKGTLSRGDTYFRQRTMPTILTGLTPTPATYIKYIEDPSISDFYPSMCDDIGRPNIIDKTIKQVNRYNFFRFSEKYILQTNTNGFSAYHALNGDQVDAIDGRITGMVMMNYIMLILQEREVTSVYIETQITYNSQGNTSIISVADSVINNKTPLKKGQGCQDKGSIIHYKERVYFWNRYKKTYNRYSDNGVTILSEENDAISYFSQLSLLLNNQRADIIASVSGATSYVTSNIIVSSIFDRQHREAILTVRYTLSFDDPSVTVITDFQTIALYDEPEKQVTGFTTRYNFGPIIYAQNHNNIVAFDPFNFQLWEFDQNSSYGSFFGFNFDQKVTLVFADWQKMVVFFKSISLHSNVAWRVYSTTPPTIENPAGQRSELVETDFLEQEGNYNASFLQNMNDPNFIDQYQALANGEDLRGYAIIVELVNSSTEQVVLALVSIDAGISTLVRT